MILLRKQKPTVKVLQVISASKLDMKLQSYNYFYLKAYNSWCSSIHLESSVVLGCSLVMIISSTYLINSINSIDTWEQHHQKGLIFLFLWAHSVLVHFLFSAVLVWRLVNIPLHRPWEKSSDLNYAQMYLSVWQRPVVSCSVQQSWSEGHAHCSHIRLKMQ